MSRQQFGFLIGFLFAWVWIVAGFGPAAATILAGLVVWLAVRVVDGDLTVAGLADRTQAAATRRQ
jgi:hypothetical protein